MNTIAFWKTWAKPYQFIFWFLSLCYVVAVGFFWYSYFINPAPAITWDRYHQLNIDEITLEVFTKGIFQLPIHGDNYLIYEILGGSALQPYMYSSWFYLVLFSVVLIILLAIVSSLSRYYFIIGMGLFCLFMMSLQLNTLQIFGLGNNLFTIVFILLFCSLGYFFHAIQTERSFIFRLLSFAVIYLLMLGLIAYSSQVSNPLLRISIHSYILSVPLCIIFILMVSHEIPASFINILTRGGRQTKSLQHFLVVVGFYLLNLLLAYGIKIGYLGLNLWVIDFFFLFTVSSLLGIWGFRQREPQYESYFRADPIGVYFILSLGILSFASLTWFMSNANDTILVVIKDLIIYGHLGYGFIFLFYVIANFGSMLSQNLQVHKVLYKPNTMPYFTFRLMGLICTFAFLVFDTNWRTPINQVFSAYYNNYGDLFLWDGDIDNAENYYNKSILFRNQNHHAHYALSAIKEHKLEPQEELKHLEAASNSYPPEQTIVNLADAYRRYGKTSEALHAIDGAKLKSKGAIFNAKGLIYMQLNMADSSLHAFQFARKEPYMKEAAETNLLAASVRFKIEYPADSLLLLLDSDKEGPKTNALALANQQNNPIDIEFTLEDATLSATRTSLLCNYIINQRETIDTALLANSCALARLDINQAFKENILISSAQAYYAQGRVKHAFELARELAYTTGKAKYFSLLGSWALEQDNSEVAYDYFAIANERPQPFGIIQMAVSLTESGNYSKAIVFWDSLANTNDTLSHINIKRITSILTSTSSQLNSIDDEGRYLFCRYKISVFDSLLFNRVVNAINDQELKSKALVEYALQWYNLDEKTSAKHYLNQAIKFSPKTESSLAQLLYLNTMLGSEMNDYNLLKEEISTNQLLNHYYKNAIILWKAKLSEKDGNTKAARNYYLYLGTANPYFDEGIVAAANFISNDPENADKLKPYSILVDGLAAKPNSVKMLKAFIRETALLGFEEESKGSIEKLKDLIPKKSYDLFIKENEDIFSLK